MRSIVTRNSVRLSLVFAGVIVGLVSEIADRFWVLCMKDQSRESVKQGERHMKMPAKYQIGNRVIWAMAAPLLVLVTLTPVAAQYQALIDADGPLVYLRLGDDGSFPEPEDVGFGSSLERRAHRARREWDRHANCAK